jgi:hypothetical protein
VFSIAGVGSLGPGRLQGRETQALSIQAVRVATPLKQCRPRSGCNPGVLVTAGRIKLQQMFQHLGIHEGTIGRDTQYGTGVVKTGRLVIAIQNVSFAAGKAGKACPLTEPPNRLISVMVRGGDYDFSQTAHASDSLNDMPQHRLIQDLSQDFSR